MDIALKDFFESKQVDSTNLSEVQNWVSRNASTANQLILASHNGKYTHSKIKKNVSCIYTVDNQTADGYIRTGNCFTGNVDTLLGLDCLGNASALPVHAFLSLKLEDDKTVFTHIEAQSETLREQLGFSKDEFEEICDLFLRILPDSEDYSTSDLLKQVYFPISEKEYHLLSILTPSALVCELKERIQQRYEFSQNGKEGRKARKENKFHPKFSCLYGIIQMKFGGEKSQNVGKLNIKMKGVGYHFNNIPPQLEERTVRLPRFDFFKECLKKWEFEERFLKILELESIPITNIKIRSAKNRIIQSIIDSIINVSWLIRKTEGGWSKRNYYSRLPEYQKIWLDKDYVASTETDWQSEIIKNMAVWIGKFEFLTTKDRNPLSNDYELKLIEGLIEEVMEAWV